MKKKLNFYKKKRGGLGYILAVVLILFITVKLLTSFEFVFTNVKSLLIDSNEKTIYIENNEL